MPSAARFCPGCGRPRTWLQEALEREAERTGASYVTLLEQAWQRETSRPIDGAQLGRIEHELRSLSTRLERIEKHTGIETIVMPEKQSKDGKPAPEPPATWLVSADTPSADPADPSRAWPEDVYSQRRWSNVDLEQLLSGRVLAGVGGLAIILGAVFFLSLAFSRGWIGPSARVTVGIIAGALMVAGGGWFFERRERLLGHVLVAVGLGTLDMAFLAGAQFYDLFAVEVALLGTLASAVVAAVIGVRANAQVVAGYGLVAALIAPPLMGATPEMSTIAYLSTILIATTGISLYRYWRWLPPIAFLFSAPQLADWVGSQPPLAPALAAIFGFWLLHAVAAGGEAFRMHHNILRPTSATLLLANAAYLVWAGFTLLDGNLNGWRGLFLTLAAIAHFALGGFVLHGEGGRPFGLLALGTGLAALSMAVPVQFGGPVVPIAWAAEAAALAWVYARLRNGYSAVAAVILGALAVGHLITIEYPFWTIAGDHANTWPFLSAEGSVLVFLLGALLAAGYFVHQRFARAALASSGLLLIVYATPFEMSGIPVVASWSALYVLAIASRQFPGLHTTHDARGIEQPARVLGARHALYLPAAIAATAAVWHTLAYELPLDLIGNLTKPDIPFTDHRTLVALILAAACLLGGYFARDREMLRCSVVAATAVLAWLIPFELESAPMVVGWSALAAGLFLLPHWDRHGSRHYVSGALALIAVGTLAVFTDIAPLGRLAVDATSRIDHALLWSGATASLLGLIGALTVGYWLQRGEPGSRWLATAPGALAVYLLSVGLVDEFQRRVGGATALEELQKQAQAGLSILWAVLGMTAIVIGIVRRVTPGRLFGLALLGIATVKVFVVDLASLDTAYRVLSFIGLGVLLLVSSWAYQHWMPQITGEEQPDPEPPPARAAR